MIMYIGVGIVSLGVGLFVGSIIASKKQNGMFNEWKQNMKQKRELKKEEAILRAQIERQARMEAMQNIKPELVEYMKQQELRKLSGEDKKDKLQKFANAFSMGGNDGGNDKINRILGVNNNNNNNNNQFNTYDKINRILGVNNNNNNNNNQFNTDDKINRILGVNNKQQQNTQEDETQRIINFMK